MEHIWQTEAYSAHICRLKNNISLTKAVFLNTNHISACFHFESFTEKNWKTPGKALNLLTVFHRRSVCLLSKLLSYNYLVSPDLWGASWHTKELESLFAVLYYSLPTLMSSKAGGIRRQLFSILSLHWKGKTTEN